MNLNHAQKRLPIEPFLKVENHYEYFQSLEQKLLVQSQKLTNFMGKSLINDKSKTKLKQALSPIKEGYLKDIKEEQKYHNIDLKYQIRQDREPHMKKVKQLPQQLRHPESYIQENQRILAYNIADFRKQAKIGDRKFQEIDEQIIDNLKSKEQQKMVEVEKIEKLEKTQKVQKENKAQMIDMEKRYKIDATEKVENLLKGDKFRIDKVDKMKRLFRMISQSKSLKDTISTQSCKSFKSIGDHINASIYLQKIKLEDFDVLKYLAKGKFGTVYLVKHKATKFLCALKRIPNLTIHDPKILTQIIREIKIQSYLDHPNIVQLYSVFVEDNDLYLLMELCFSGNLYSSLKTVCRFNEDKIRLVIKQVCNAVEYMHDNDILHRDLKPQNILFHQSIVKICDFGWSVNSPLLRDTLCGTPLYSSPEVVQRQQYDNKVDIWNIGVLTYELLYGKVPFEIRTEDDLSKVVDDNIYFPRSKPASPEIKDFILHCLSKNPKERFSITKLIDHQFLNPVEINRA